MICQNNVAVSALGTHGEVTHFIGVELDCGLNPDVEFCGLDGGELAGDVRKVVEGDRLRLFLHGPESFARLGEVSFEGLH